MRTGFYPGSFDPITFGHLDVIARAARLVDRLVIGIGTYQSAPALANPVRDARAIGEALRRLNFEVDEVFEPDFRRLTRSVREFGIKAQRADAAVVYYAGHGVQVGRENFLLPSDARLERERRPTARAETTPHPPFGHLLPQGEKATQRPPASYAIALPLVGRATTGSEGPLTSVGRASRVPATSR